MRQNQINSSYVMNNFQFGGNFRERIFRDYHFTEEEEDWERGTRYRKRGLTLGTYQTRRIAGQLFLRQEFNDELEAGWQPLRESITFGGESYLDIGEQRFRATYSHREVKHLPDGGENKYDIAEISISNSILNRGLTLRSNYWLSNLEFYPYVRELMFVGEGIGVYDSTGVVADDGEYDYTMVQVGEPEMSIEINADMMLNITPRLFSSRKRENSADNFRSLLTNWFDRIQSETYYLVMENSRSDKKWDVYLLSSSHLMNEETTIYGRNMFRQTTWFDIIHGKILSKFAYQRDRMLDNRYQDSQQTDITSREVMLRFSRILASDFELTYENRSERESRYDSLIESDVYSLDIRNRVGRNLQIGSRLKYTEESGDRTVGGVSYTLRSYGITETLSYFFQRRYRLFGRLEYRRNERKGSGFLAFLPDKREGNVFRWNMRLNYQLNPFTSAGLEYSGNKYPLQDTVHQMKLEIRAEF